MKNKKTQEEIDKINEVKKVNEKFFEEQGWKFKDYNPEIPWFAQTPALQWDKEEECYYAIIFDAETEPLIVMFPNDGTFQIETEGLLRIHLDGINNIQDLMCEAAELYDNMTDEEG
jgi:hypothetical protein